MFNRVIILNTYADLLNAAANYYQELNDKVNDGIIDETEAVRCMHWFTTVTAPRLLSEAADRHLSDRG